MVRYALAGVALAVMLSAVPVRGDDADPEPPPRTRSEARSGDYFVKASANGYVSASNKKEQLLWRYDMQIKGNKAGQVVIGGDRVVVAHDNMLFALDLATGKALWIRTHTLTKATMRLDRDRIILSSGGSKDVTDLSTGRQLEGVRVKP